MVDWVLNTPLNFEQVPAYQRVFAIRGVFKTSQTCTMKPFCEIS